MAKEIRYLNLNNVQCKCRVADQLFDETSSTRKHLKNHSGVDFKDEQEVINWVIKKDVIPFALNEASIQVVDV